MPFILNFCYTIQKLLYPKDKLTVTNTVTLQRFEHNPIFLKRWIKSESNITKWVFKVNKINEPKREDTNKFIWMRVYVLVLCQRG